MEIYAGFLEQVDHARRATDRHARRTSSILDDTLIFYILGDNGASAEGTLNGCFNEMTTLNGMPGIETTEFLLSARSTISAHPKPTTTTRSAGRMRCVRRTSGPSRSHRTGAARATAPSFTGRTASKGRGEMRTQFHHVIDVAKTILDVAGLPEPTIVNSIAQAPFEGVSMMPSFADATRRKPTTCSTSR